MNKKGIPNNVIRIPTSLKKDFFRIWIEFLTPLHSLTNKEKDVAAILLKERYKLSKAVNDPALLDRILLGDETKNTIKEELKITEAFLRVIFRKLKSTKFIVDNKINAKFIPKNLKDDDTMFQLLFFFDLKKE
jgi:hypothetical protein